MDKYEEIKRIIEEAEIDEDAEFPKFGSGTSDKWIEWAERKLDMKLPESYKWWLKNYNGGEIFGDEIFSIYEQENPGYGDIVGSYKINQRDEDFPDNIVEIFSANEGDELYYFDKNEKRSDGELSVYEYYDAEKPYAKDFIEFLKKQLTE